MTFTPRNVVNLFIVYELDRLSQDLNANFTQRGCSLGAVKLTKNADPHKYSHSRFGTGFDFCSLFSFSDFDWSKNVVIFVVDNS